MDVFISYSRKDYKVADRLCREMDKVGISYFIDRKGITGGDHFIKTISKEIISCKVFVFIGSISAYQSIWTMKEVTFAFQEKGGQNVIPILTDKSPLPEDLRFLFTNVNVILPGESSVNQTINALLRMLGRTLSESFNFQDAFMKLKNSRKSQRDEILFWKFEETYGPISDFDLYESPYIKEVLCSIDLPFKIVQPKFPCTENYDWNLFTRLFITSEKYNVKSTFGTDYFFDFSKKWKMNLQNEPEIVLKVLGHDNDGFWADRGIHEMREHEVYCLQQDLLMELIDSMLTWEYSKDRGTAMEDRYSKKLKLEKEISLIEKSVFNERIKHFEKVGDFHEDRARVYQNNSIGFIDTKGMLVTPIEWEDAGDFSEGLACVCDWDSDFGYIDKEGNVAIPFKWLTASPFKNGVAEVQDEDFNHYLIDKEGNIIDD